jgi:hypothetical protein
MLLGCSLNVLYLEHSHGPKKYKYSQKYGKKILMHFGESYFGLEDDDKCVTIGVALPISLKDELDKYCKQMRIPKSRYIRILIEKDLKLSYDVL